jgi:shikimate dehydrogenase
VADAAAAPQAAIDSYAVMGNPVAHSRSPLIHAAFARQTGQSLQYRAILVPLGGFAAALEAFQNEGGKGLNVTLPFKGDAWAAMDVRTPRAERCGSVNTIRFDTGGERFGDNTDGIGLLRDLDRLGIPVEDASVLVLGAGGAVSGVLGDLLDRRPSRLKIVNRTPQRATALVERFSSARPILESGKYESLPGECFKLVINGTSLSLAGELPPLPDDLLADGACCYDMVYGERETVFVEWARRRGAAVSADGLGMLVEQAAESFYIWRGVRPETEPVMAMLRNRKDRG